MSDAAPPAGLAGAGQAEQALRESEARLNAVVGSAIDAIVSTDVQGRIELFNPAAERTFGHPASAMLGQPLDRLQPDLVLLDLQLGERSGLELLAALDMRAISTRVIVLTMSDQARHVAEALRLGAVGYVLKGSPSAELLAAIDAAGRGQRYLGAGAAELAVRDLTEAAGDRQLSPRERQIVLMVVRGKSSAAIGEALHLSSKTVDTYRSRLMAKLGVADVPALVRWAIREGLVGLDEA